MTAALVAELLYRAPPALDMPAVLAHVRRTLPDTVLDDAGRVVPAPAGRRHRRRRHDPGARRDLVELRAAAALVGPERRVLAVSPLV